MSNNGLHISVLLFAFVWSVAGYSAGSFDNSSSHIPILSAANEVAPIDPQNADLGIRFDEKETWQNYVGSVLPDSLSVVRTALAVTSIHDLTFRDLADPTTFERISPSTFLAFLMTNRIVLPSGHGNELTDDEASEKRSQADKEYDRLMQVGYARYRQILASKPAELIRFVELVDVALSNSTALGQSDVAEPVFDFQNLKRPVAKRVDELITHVLDLWQYPRLYVKRRVNGRADCVNMKCNELEFAQAFFSRALTDQERNIAAMMDAEKSAKNRLSVRQWLDICVRALAFERGTTDYATVLRFANAEMELLRTERVFQESPSEEQLADFLDLTKQLIQLGSKLSPEDTTFAGELLLHFADQSVMPDRDSQNRVDIKFDKTLWSIKSGSPLDKNLRDLVRIYVRSKEWHESPETAPLTVEILRQAIIQSNRSGRPLLKGLRLTRSCAQIFFTRPDGTRRF